MYITLIITTRSPSTTYTCSPSTDPSRVSTCMRGLSRGAPHLGPQYHTPHTHILSRSDLVSKYPKQPPCLIQYTILRSWVNNHPTNTKTQITTRETSSTKTAYAFGTKRLHQFIHEPNVFSNCQNKRIIFRIVPSRYLHYIRKASVTDKSGKNSFTS